MKYFSHASSSAKSHASFHVKESDIAFGITPENEANLPNPAELFLGTFSACILKNVERFFEILDFEYSKAEIEVNATRLEKPPRMDEISYVLKIYSNDDRLNTDLLKRTSKNLGRYLIPSNLRVPSLVK